MPRRVSKDIERLVRLIRPVQQQLGSEHLGPLALPLQLREARNRVVDVHLHRHVMGGPGRPLQTLDLCERQLAGTVGVDEDEPVRIVRHLIRRRFIARPVVQAQELPIELGQGPSVSGVDGDVQQLRVLSHAHIFPGAARDSLRRFRSGQTRVILSPLTLICRSASGWVAGGFTAEPSSIEKPLPWHWQLMPP